MYQQIQAEEEYFLLDIFDLFSPKKIKKVIKFQESKRIIKLNETINYSKQKKPVKKQITQIDQNDTYDDPLRNFDVGILSIDEVLQQYYEGTLLKQRISSYQQLQSEIQSKIIEELQRFLVSDVNPLNVKLVKNIYDDHKTNHQEFSCCTMIINQFQSVNLEKQIFSDKENLKLLQRLNESQTKTKQIDSFQDELRQQFDNTIFENIYFADGLNQKIVLNDLLTNHLKQNPQSATEPPYQPVQTKIDLIEIQAQLTQSFYEGLLCNRNSKVSTLSLINKKQRLTSDAKEFQLKINNDQNDENKLAKPQVIYIQNHITYPPKPPIINSTQSQIDYILPRSYANHPVGSYNNQNRDEELIFNFQTPISTINQSQIIQMDQLQYSINPDNQIYQALPLQASIRKIQINPSNVIDQQSNLKYNSLQQSHHSETLRMNSQQSSKVVFVNSRYSSQQGVLMQTPQLHIVCVALSSNLFYDNEFAIIDDHINIYLLLEKDICLEANNDAVQKHAITEFYKFINKLNFEKKNTIFIIMDESNLLRPIIQETKKITDHKPGIEFYQIKSFQQINYYIISMIQMGISQISSPINLNKILNLSLQIEMMDHNKLMQKKKMSQLYQTLCSFLF